MDANKYKYIICETRDDGIFYVTSLTREILAFVQAGSLTVNKHRVTEGELEYITSHYATRNSMTFTPQHANDLEDVHDNLIAEADLLARVAQDRSLGEAEILLTRSWEKKMRHIALNMANQLPWVVGYDINDYKVKE